MEPKLTDRLHAAIQTGAWSTAQELLASFRLEVETSWLTASTEQERRDISQNVTGFLQWARAMTMIDREHVHARLGRLNRRHAYAGPHPSNPHRGLDA
jgi:hypothetical protein